MKHDVWHTPQPMANQWRIDCICGWQEFVSLIDFPTHDQARIEAQRLFKEHKAADVTIA